MAWAALAKGAEAEGGGAPAGWSTSCIAVHAGFGRYSESNGSGRLRSHGWRHV